MNSFAIRQPRTRAVPTFIRSLILALAIAATNPSLSLAVEAKHCRSFFAALGAVVGTTIGVIVDISAGGTTGGSGTMYGAKVGPALGASAGGASSLALCPTNEEMPSDEASSLGVVLKYCLNNYYHFMNPFPFTNSIDFCSIPGNRYIRANDISRLPGYQIEIPNLIRKINFQIEMIAKLGQVSEADVRIVRQLSDELTQCSNSYRERKSTKFADRCTVQISSITRNIWPRENSNGPALHAIEAVDQLLNKISKPDNSSLLRATIVEVAVNFFSKFWKHYVSNN